MAAAIVLTPGSDLDADTIRSECGKKLAKYKVPRYIWLLTEPLPRNASGKFLKRQLREDLQITDAS